MKKTIVALAVAAVAATSANAATVYNQDGTKVDVNGSLRLILKKEKNERGDLVDNGSRVSFKASHDLGEGLSALAYTELRFSKNVPVQVKDQQGEVVREYEVEKLGNNVHVKRLYAGFAYEGLGTLTFGNQLTIGDDVGLSDYIPISTVVLITSFLAVKKQLTLNLQNSMVSHLVVRMSSLLMLTNKHYVMVAVSL